MNMKQNQLAVAFLALAGSFAQAQAPVSWKSESFWRDSVAGNLNFFRAHAWDENSGSYASELDASGKLSSQNRDAVPLGRMIYADATAPGSLQDLRRARKSADFLLKHFAGRDGYGMYFKSVVDEAGNEVNSGRNYVFIFEEAYPITGLTALYAADPRANADLLPIIRDAAQSFWKRFHDPVNGGLFYYYNFSKADHSNDQGVTHKSYQSNIYPISSFLFALRRADLANAAVYDGWIGELLDITVNHIVERSNGQPTGWLLERMSPDFVVDATYKMTEAGHISQLSWVLGMAVKGGIVTDPARRKRYLETSRALLSKFIQHGGFSSLGTVFDAFDRTTGEPWSEGGAAPTTAWWSNLETVIAYAFAMKHEVLGYSRNREIAATLNGLTSAYARYFVDYAQGGEFFRVDAITGQVVDSTKGGPGKSAYHIGEVYQYLFGEAGLAR